MEFRVNLSNLPVYMYWDANNTVGQLTFSELTCNEMAIIVHINWFTCNERVTIVQNSNTKAIFIFAKYEWPNVDAVRQLEDLPW